MVGEDFERLAAEDREALWGALAGGRLDATQAVGGSRSAG